MYIFVEKRRQEGARDKDISFSGTSSIFNQTEFNKVLLENVLKTQSSVAKILGIGSLSPHVAGNPKFEYANMVEDIKEKVSSEMERFFHENEE
ncbi:relaxosome protein TraM [Salmonella enterica]|uniref:relaxosome protein TraM n=1 Tax=Salmonella enterica TaxID=28901 RepID=UPI000CCC9E0C|nr:conjugal transfer protein TraM [Salmonella enterica]